MVRGGRYYWKNYWLPIYRHFFKLSAKIEMGIIEKLSIPKMCIRFHPTSTVPKTKWENVSYMKWIWVCLWKQCTKLSGNTRQTYCIVKYVHSFHSFSWKNTTSPSWFLTLGSFSTILLSAAQCLLMCKCSLRILIQWWLLSKMLLKALLSLVEKTRNRG